MLFKEVMAQASVDKSVRKEIKRARRAALLPLLGRVAYSKLLGLCVLNVGLMCSHVLCSYWLLLSQSSHSTPEGLLPTITMQRQPDPALWRDRGWEVGKRGGEHSGLGQGSGGEGGSEITQNGSGRGGWAGVMSLLPAAWHRGHSGTCNGWESTGKVQQD